MKEEILLTDACLYNIHDIVSELFQFSYHITI